MRRIAFLVIVLAAALTFSAVDRSRALTPAGVYTGLSSQRLPVQLTVAEDGATLALKVDWVGRCTGIRSKQDLPIEQTTALRATSIAESGEFSWQDARVELGDDGDETRQRLRVAGRRNPDGTIIGTWSAEQDHYNGQVRAVDTTCASGLVQFSVSIGGSVRPPAPVRDGAGNLVIALERSPIELAAGAGVPWVLSASPVIGNTGRAPMFVTEIDPLTGEAGAGTPVPTRGLAYLGADDAGAYTVEDLQPTRRPPLSPRLVHVARGTHRVAIGPRRSRLIKEEVYVGGLAVGAGGAWLLTREHVLRAEPRSGRMVRRVAVPHDPRGPITRRCRAETTTDGLAAGAGAVWVASTTVHRCALDAQHHDIRQRIYHTLSRIDPSTDRVTRRVALRHVPTKLAAGSGGVWMTACTAAGFDGCAGSRHPRGEILYHLGRDAGRLTLVARLPAGPVAGLAADRATAWISQGAEGERRGALRRVDRIARRLTTVLEQAGPPSNVVVAGGAAWMLDLFERTLIRVAG